jgi:hypothetical protein
MIDIGSEYFALVNRSISITNVLLEVHIPEQAFVFSLTGTARFPYNNFCRLTSAVSCLTFWDINRPGKVGRLRFV